ncbi:MAG: ATP-binding protein [Epsilonproteobacteria bacterium]|nr:ATP-binding protein [Campylobacterota bacterium]
MNILDFLYEQDFKKINFLDRKISIKAKKSFIYGTKKSGKTYLMFDYLNRFPKKETLYIDLNDDRIDKEEVKNNLQNFISQKGINTLAIDNFDFSFALPQCENILISSDRNHPIEGFEKIHLFPLDFEEFISFYKKYSNLETMFNIYAKLGTYPHTILHYKENTYQNMQEMIKASLSKEEYMVFRKFALFQGMKKSLFQIYNLIKKEHKISKDTFYKTVNELKEREFIFLIDKFDQPKSPKKIFLIDFTLKNIFTFQKDFMKMFENMIFLELIKRGYDLTYTENAELYDPKNKIVFLSMPFLPADIIKTKLNLLENGFKKEEIKKVYVITLEYEESFFKNKTEYLIESFWNFAIKI